MLGLVLSPSPKGLELGIGLGLSPSSKGLGLGSRHLEFGPRLIRRCA